MVGNILIVGGILIACVYAIYRMKTKGSCGDCPHYKGNSCAKGKNTKHYKYKIDL